MRLVPRKEGDPPLAPAVAEAVRKAGFDPAKFTLAPGDDAIASALPPAGQRVRHNFRFATLNGALAAIERILGDDAVASIAKAGDGYRLTVDLASAADDAGTHATIAGRVHDLGATDEGMIRETINVNTQVRRAGGS